MSGFGGKDLFKSGLFSLGLADSTFTLVFYSPNYFVIISVIIDSFFDFSSFNLDSASSHLLSSVYFLGWFSSVFKSSLSNVLLSSYSDSNQPLPALTCLSSTIPISLKPESLDIIVLEFY